MDHAVIFICKVDVGMRTEARSPCIKPRQMVPQIDQCYVVHEFPMDNDMDMEWTRMKLQ